MTDLLEHRTRLLEGLAGPLPLDVLVVGGGINGVGVLLDAVTRGLSTGLVERDDLAVGTSSRSSKLIHGGLRYLERLDLGLVREALRERDLLVGLAPHLVTLRRFAVPVVGGRWQLPYIGSGLTLYDLLGGRRGGRFEMLTSRELARRLPQLDPTVAVGGFEYTDGVCDDARMVLAVAETARRRGARVLTRAEAGVPRHRGGCWEVDVVDRLGGEMTVRARSVVDVTGAFEADTPVAGLNVTTSRGVHLVVAGHHFTGTTGLTVRVPGRVVFVIPWGRRWLIGTTDVAHEGPIDRPFAASYEVDYLLDAVNGVLSRRIERSDVIATFAGVRPLAGGGHDDTVSASREHTMSHDGRGLVSVRGGKYTTYRLIAAEIVDEVCSFLGIDRVSVTERTPLVGAAAPPVLDEVVDDLVARGLDEVNARWLVGRHGVEATHVLAVGTEVGLGGVLHPDMPYLEADAWWAIHREGALTLDDVLARRTRLAIETADHGVAAAPLVARLLADVYGWATTDIEQAVGTYMASAHREYRVP